MREMRESPQLGSLRLLVRFIILSALLSAGAAALCVLTAALAGRLSPGPAVWAAALAVPAAFGALTALLAGAVFQPPVPTAPGQLPDHHRRGSVRPAAR